MGKEYKEKSPFIAIPASLGGLMVGALVIVLIFSPSNADVLHSLIWGLVILGFFGMVFAHISMKKFCVKEEKGKKKK